MTIFLPGGNAKDPKLCHEESDNFRDEATALPSKIEASSMGKGVLHFWRFMTSYNQFIDNCIE